MNVCDNNHERIAWEDRIQCPLCEALGKNLNLKFNLDEAYIEIDQLKDQACASIIKVMDLEKQIATLRGMNERLQNEVFVTAGIGSK